MLNLASQSHRSARRSGLLATAALMFGLFGLLATSATEASAATHIQQAGGFYCEGANVKVSPPRVWSNRGRPEQVVWGIGLQRFNGQRWVAYSTSFYRSTFNHFGQSVTSWSVFNTRTGGRYINSRLNVPVAHRGYYRVTSAVAAPGLQSAIYVPGGHCYIA